MILSWRMVRIVWCGGCDGWHSWNGDADQCVLHRAVNGHLVPDHDPPAHVGVGIFIQSIVDERFRDQYERLIPLPPAAHPT